MTIERERITLSEELQDVDFPAGEDQVASSAEGSDTPHDLAAPVRERFFGPGGVSEDRGTSLLRRRGHYFDESLWSSSSAIFRASIMSKVKRMTPLSLPLHSK